MNYRSIFLRSIGLANHFVVQECAGIRLSVLSDNTNAVDFYKKSGFMPHDLEMVMKI